MFHPARTRTLVSSLSKIILTYQKKNKTGIKYENQGSEAKTFNTAQKLLLQCNNIKFSQMRPCTCGHMGTVF